MQAGVVFCAGASLTLLLASVNAQQGATEYQVKAAYLYNFAKAAHWSSQSLPPESNLIIGIFGGEEDFVRIARDTLAGKNINGHALEIRHLRSADEVRFCHLAFFRSSERLSRTALKYADVLLVGEDRQFLAEGGMIALVMSNGKITYEMNSAAVQRSNVSYGDTNLARAGAGSGGGVSEGSRSVAFRVTPDYPAIAAKMNLTGAVQLQAVVRADGTVKQVRVLGGHPLLADSASRAVMQWRFEPASKESTELVRISFGH